MPDDIQVTRPQRWGIPFSPDMSADEVESILALPLFAGMDAARFPKSTPLAGIVRNDCALHRYEDKQQIVRQGDYGSSAFLIIAGEVQVFLDGDIPEQQLGHAVEAPKSLLRQLWRTVIPTRDEAPRHLLAVSGNDDVAGDATAQVFFQDLPAVTRKGAPPPVMKAGAIFGEMSALGRTPRSATVVASGPCDVLEIRWQGLRDLRNGDKGFKTYIDGIYRERNLTSDHFSTTPLFSEVHGLAIDALRSAAVFESHGSFEWSGAFKKGRQDRRSGKKTVANEPVICAEGSPAEHLYLVRAGFARVSHKVGAGDITTRYVGRGEIFGLVPLHAAVHKTAQPVYHSSLHALGYVDVIRLPLATVAAAIRGNTKALAWLEAQSTSYTATRNAAHQQPLTGEMMEFGTESRLYNGSSVMSIDLNRCTRCDDCVRGCSSAHGGTPRFVRHGEVSQGFLFPNACMHCKDPVCMIGCPTGAISRTKNGGQVVVNGETCIGCSTCANSCPYDNIRMVERTHAGAQLVDQKGNAVMQASKCDLCYDQVDGPACVRSCPHDALHRVDFAGVIELLGRRGSDT